MARPYGSDWSSICKAGIKEQAASLMRQQSEPGGHGEGN
jgi:hypothetical protein